MKTKISAQGFLDNIGWIMVILIILVLSCLIFLPWEKVPPDDIEIVDLHPCLFVNDRWTLVDKFTVLQYPTFCGVLKTQYPPVILTVEINQIDGVAGYEGNFEDNSGDFIIHIPKRLKPGEYELVIRVGRTKALMNFTVTRSS